MMSLLRSLRAPANIAIVGASGGIGSALLERLRADQRVGSLHAFSRQPINGPADKVAWRRTDLLDERSLRTAARAAARIAPLDLVLVTTGILHRGADLQPEKQIHDISANNLAEVLAVNTIGPTMVAKYFLPQMRRDHKSVFAALSARVGSINDNRLGGWTSYRASKAALNMVVRTLAIEHSRAAPQSVVVSLHPGTVDTELAKPFSARVPKDRLFSPDRAGLQLLNVIDSLKAEDSGGFFAWDGSAIDC